MSMLNKISRFASSPQGRQAINSVTSRGTTGRSSARRTGRRGAPASGGAGAGGTIGRLASSFLSGRRR